MITQRKNLLGPDYDRKNVEDEFQHIHDRLNGFDRDRRVFQDYTITVDDRRIACLRAGIVLRLPVLRRETSGWSVYVKDKSGVAGSDFIEVKAPPSFEIEGQPRTLITSNYGSLRIEWDADEEMFFLV